jgi:hypothetical protein
MLTNDTDRLALRNTTTAQASLLLGKAERQLDALKGEASSKQLLALSNSFNNANDFSKSAKYAKAALDQNPQHFEAASAHVMFAMSTAAIGGPSALPLVREHFDKAENAVPPGTLQANLARAQTLVRRIQIELWFGDCATAPELYRRFSEVERAPDIRAEERVGLKQMMQFIAVGARPGCSLPPEALAYIGGMPAVPPLPGDAAGVPLAPANGAPQSSSPTPDP